LYLSNTLLLRFYQWIGISGGLTSMKKTFLLPSLCACVAFSIVSCDKLQAPQSQPQQQVAQPQPKQEAEQPKSGPLTVKGFYIGMPRADAWAQIKKTEFFNEGQASWTDTSITVITKKLESLFKRPEIDFYFVDGKLDQFTWFPGAVDLMFSSVSLTASELVDNFTDAYKVPRFTYRIPTGETKGEWVSYTADNVKITINPDKYLQVERDGSRHATRNSFN